MNLSLIKERVGLLKGWIDCRWSALPVKKQRTLVLYLFAGYVVITMVVITGILYRGEPRQNGEIQHIDNPIPLKKQSRFPPAVNLLDTSNHN
ncbi:hypothetical protein SAMN04488128_103770 [Chitinophaga eiseniae]|uniref:Nitrogen regulatory IIA protein n=1 Tax=Chitinophaga eiseniae TaxID=634771 RepID=A0A1T4SY09_9BACT|nr:hypothetical protein [Chitinophaga eiseniae]SKA33113.1 hypothetical protein SAMN04488128_103770 [Chitinophaga eiseniae]